MISINANFGIVPTYSFRITALKRGCLILVRKKLKPPQAQPLPKNKKIIADSY